MYGTEISLQLPIRHQSVNAEDNGGIASPHFSKFKAVYPKSCEKCNYPVKSVDVFSCLRSTNLTILMLKKKDFLSRFPLTCKDFL